MAFTTKRPPAESDVREFELTRGTHFEGGRKLRVGEIVQMTMDRFLTANLSDRFVPVPRELDGQEGDEPSGEDVAKQPRKRK